MTLLVFLPILVPALGAAVHAVAGWRRATVWVGTVSALVVLAAAGTLATWTVTSGAALLRFQADAESSGRRGDNVLVRNPENGKLFQARVEGKGPNFVWAMLER